MKRPLDTTVRPVGVNALCGAEYVTCPVSHPDAPWLCPICSTFTGDEVCHRCNCTVCHLERTQWYQRIARRRLDLAREAGLLFL